MAKENLTPDAGDALVSPSSVDDLGRVGSASGIELTEREKALARGEEVSDEADDYGESFGGETDESASRGESSPGDRPARQDPPAQQDAPSWMDDDGVRFTAERMGFASEDLANFDSARSFYAAARIVHDRVARTAQALRGSQPSPPQEGESKGAPGESPAKSPPAELKPLNPDGTLNPDYFLAAEQRGEDPYGEDTLAIVQTLRQLHETVGALQKEWAESQKAYEEQLQIAQENAFHDALDEFDPEFFGQSLDAKGMPVNLPDEQASRREAMREAILTLRELEEKRASASGQGYRPPSWDEIRNKAYVLAFGQLPPSVQSPAPSRSGPGQRSGFADPLDGRPQVGLPDDDIDPLQATPGQREKLLRAAGRVRGVGTPGAVAAGSRIASPGETGVQSAASHYDMAMQEAERIANLPAVRDKWNQLTRSNGS